MYTITINSGDDLIPLRKELDRLPIDSDLDIHIGNSYDGSDVYTAMFFVGLLRRFTGNKKVTVDAVKPSMFGFLKEGYVFSKD